MESSSRGRGVYRQLLKCTKNLEDGIFKNRAIRSFWQISKCHQKNKIFTKKFHENLNHVPLEDIALLPPGVGVLKKHWWIWGNFPNGFWHSFGEWYSLNINHYKERHLISFCRRYSTQASIRIPHVYHLQILSKYTFF